MRVLRSLIHKVLAWFDPTKDTIRRLAKIRLRAGDIAVDCGANVGDITQILARRGAEVYAFEPNPYAFQALQKRFESRSNVHCLATGVSDASGKAALFMHERAGENAVFWSTGSSLLDFKSNVDVEKFVEVELVDLAAFIKGLGKRVRVVKVDVEGVECRVVNHLIDTGVIHLIDHVFVETHDHRIPELVNETERLRKRVRDEGYEQVIDLTWK